MSDEVKRKRGRPRGPAKVRPVSDYDPHHPLSEEHKQRIGEGMKKAYAEGRKITTDQQREALRQSMLGKSHPHSEDWVRKCRETRAKNKKLKEQGE